ncbi:MAG: ribonuclease protein component [Rickettsiales bacterium]|nr:ribonuclease protein component [Rickettsiales bacterium]
MRKISPILRIKKRDDFVRLTKRGEHVFSKSVILQAAKYDPATVFPEDVRAPDQRVPVRVGFTVSGKVGNAVVRNRIKRRYRVLVEKVFPSLARAGHDYVLVGRKSALDRPFLDMERDLRYCLHAVELALSKKESGEGKG